MRREASLVHDAAHEQVRADASEYERTQAKRNRFSGENGGAVSLPI